MSLCRGRVSNSSSIICSTSQRQPTIYDRNVTKVRAAQRGHGWSRYRLPSGGDGGITIPGASLSKTALRSAIAQVRFDRRHAGGEPTTKMVATPFLHPIHAQLWPRRLLYVRVVLSGRVDLEGFRRDLAHVGAPMIEQE